MHQNLTTMKLKRYIGIAALALPIAATAQVSIGFEDDSEYTAIGVYDSWDDSPFRTGELEGNVAIISNELQDVDEVLGEAANSTDKMLAFQRSRWGSNQYGARIDLPEPIQLSSTETQYVHVLLYKEKAGRVMLIGLGRRTDRPWQSETEQFHELSTTTVSSNKWYDAVFAISGSDSALVNTLVVVPHLESTHDLDEDFMAYIDEIVVNESSTARFSYDYYQINYDKTSAELDRTDRYTTSIGLESPSGGDQTMDVSQKSTQLLYEEILDDAFVAKAGESVTPSIGYNSTWMHGYVYIDKGVDGQFEAYVNDDYELPDSSDLVSFSYYNGYNSLGEEAAQGSSIQPPVFTIPEDLEPGFYRMRYKIDWNNIDPGGSTDEDNAITDNGGVIVDTRLNVHEDSVTISRGVSSDGVGGLNGDVWASDGTELGGRKIPFGEAYTIMTEPSSGFTLSYVVVRHGYNLDGDSLVYDTPQYSSEYIPSYAFEDGMLTLPASYIDGDVEIIAYFSAVSDDSSSDEDYPINFDDTLTVTRTDRYLSVIRMKTSSTGTETIRCDGSQATVYQDKTSYVVPAMAGDEITTTIGYTGNSMHIYLYIDFNQDGAFDYSLNSDGTPTYSSEVVSYTYYDSHNSQGETITDNAGTVSMDSLPTFILTDLLPTGVYRARLKVDWNNIDPGGNYGGSSDIDDNGGAIVDFLINVYGDDHPLTTEVTNGSINSGTTSTSTNGVAETTSCYSSLRLRLTPIEDTYEADSITIRHGHLDKEQFIHGNRQWSEYKIKYSKIFTIASDSVNGDLYISADFEPTSDSEYFLVFSDEFDQEDGSLPDESIWTRATRYSSAWNRYLSKTDEEHALTGYIEDGKFIAKTLPNPYQDTDDVAMISGGIITSGNYSFTYGKIEARILTYPYEGNFPAFWMLPQKSVTWPYGGEIDIWEQIDDSDTSWHTIHSEWADINGNSDDPDNSGSNSNTTNGKYHTFGLEWEEDLLTWYVDGKEVFSYAKSDDEDDIDEGQWPFDNDFYIILNQSVGNGSWAADGDTDHTYITKFDWVRVYQLGDQIEGIHSATTSGHDNIGVTASSGNIRVVAAEATDVTIYDMSGRCIYNETVQGNKNISVIHGVYIVNGKKVLVP